MKIAIIGAGSMGLLFASYLSRNVSITLYTRTMEQARNINQNGLTLMKNLQKQIFTVNARPIEEWQGTEDLAIITVKQYQLQTIIKKIKALQTVPMNLLFLQNGMGHLKLLETIPADNIFVGSVEHGALKVNGSTVSHNGEGVVNLAVFKGNPSMIQQFLSLLPSTFPMALNKDCYAMLLNKLIINAVVNPLTAILGVKNGELINNPFYFRVLTNLFDEISNVLDLNDGDHSFQKILAVCRNTADNRSSMLKDLEANRKTEVDAIVGFLLEEAAKKGKEAPQLENLYFLIKGKEVDSV